MGRSVLVLAPIEDCAVLDSQAKYRFVIPAQAGIQV
jgi:hypothetical protein